MKRRKREVKKILIITKCMDCPHFSMIHHPMGANYMCGLVMKTFNKGYKIPFWCPLKTLKSIRRRNANLTRIDF